MIEYIVSHMAQSFDFKGKVHIAAPDGPLCGAQSEAWLSADTGDVTQYGLCKRCVKKIRCRWERYFSGRES